MTMKSCPYCQETIQAGAVLCRFCKTDLQTGNPPARRSAPPPKKSNATLIIVIVCCVITVPALIVLAALFLLVSSAGPNDRLKASRTRAILEQTANTVEEFKLDTNQYPRNLDDLRKRPSHIIHETWNGPYLRKIAVDGWEREIYYEVPGPGQDPYKLYSLGADGRKGGEGFDADIVQGEY